MDETVARVSYREGLPGRPARMMARPLNDKGYPVPWFVEWVDGKPEFRLMDPAKWGRAIRHRLCWLCGEALGANMTFVSGPMCGVNRTSAEPPSHHDCATYAAKACPFLTLPKALRRDAGLPDEVRSVGGIGIARNPGVAMLWTTREFHVARVDNGYIIKMGEPIRVEWYAQGRAATRAEVDESIRTGLPALQQIADQQQGAPELLRQYVERFARYLPPAVAAG